MKGYRDRTLVLAAIGALLLLVGLGMALLAPLEMYTFYLFSDGGRFHYEGFGFGSFMFGNIAAQIAGYYALAAVCIPLGYGHIRVRRWARTLALACLGCWRIVGAPLVLLTFLVLLASKEVSVGGAVVAAVLLCTSYLIVPALLTRFYRGSNVVATFEARDPGGSALERQPIPVLVLCLLYVFYAIALHVPILFNGLYPVAGHFLTGLEGILALDLSIVVLGWLLWGTWGRKRWAWWGGLLYFGWMTFSWTVTLARSSYTDLLAVMDLPARELEFLSGVPLEGPHFAVFIGAPFAATWVAIALSRRHWMRHGEAAPSRPARSAPH